MEPISETNMIQLVLFGMQNRTLGPYVAGGAEPGGADCRPGGGGASGMQNRTFGPYLACQKGHFVPVWQVAQYLEALTVDLEAAAHPALDELTEKITSKRLDRVRTVKSRMVRLTTRVETVSDGQTDLRTDRQTVRQEPHGAPHDQRGDGE
jgi:hypothetical protein